MPRAARWLQVAREPAGCVASRMSRASDACVRVSVVCQRRNKRLWRVCEVQVSGAVLGIAIFIVDEKEGVHVGSERRRRYVRVINSGPFFRHGWSHDRIEDEIVLRVVVEQVVRVVV